MTLMFLKESKIKNQMQLLPNRFIEEEKNEK